MKKGLSEVVFILDASGSMSKICNDTIGSFNTFIKDQKKVSGQCDFSLVLFNSGYDLVIDKKDIQEIRELDTSTYIPRDWTALLDAIGKTINKVGERLYCTKESERPEKVIFVILTDGEENRSKEFTKQQIAEMIKHQTEKYNWKFLFLGANQDSFLNSRELNIQYKYTANYFCDSLHVEKIYDSISTCVTSFRSGSDYDLSNDNQTVESTSNI